MAAVTPGKVVPLGAPPEMNNNRMLPGSKEESMLHWKLKAPVAMGTGALRDTMTMERDSGFKEKCKTLTAPSGGGRDSNDSGGETGKATCC